MTKRVIFTKYWGKKKISSFHDTFSLLSPILNNIVESHVKHIGKYFNSTQVLLLQMTQARMSQKENTHDKNTHTVGMF